MVEVAVVARIGLAQWCAGGKKTGVGAPSFGAISRPCGRSYAVCLIARLIDRAFILPKQFQQQHACYYCSRLCFSSC